MKTRFLFGALVGGIVGSCLGYYSKKQIDDGIMNSIRKKEKKFETYYGVLNQWMENIQNGKKMDDYLLSQGIESIAIYGMGELGKKMYKELAGSKVDVIYGIDQVDTGIYNGLTIVGLEEELRKVDAIIVTPSFAYDEIVDVLVEKTDSRILSIEDVIFGME